MRDRPKLGEILVKAGIIDDMQLNSALGEQARWGRRLGVTLIKMGMVEEGHLVRALATQLDLPVASLAGKRIPDDVIALVPSRVASKHCVIPLFIKRAGNVGQLFLGMEDPSNLAVLDDLSFRTGMEVHPVMVGPTELGAAIDRYYLGSGKKHDSSKANARNFDGREPMGELSLHVVHGDPADPASSTMPPLPVSPSTRLKTQVPPTPTPTPRAAVALPPVSRDAELSFREKKPTVAPSAPVLPAGLIDDVARAIDDTDRTRVVVKAITQILVEKGILSLDEVQDHVAQIKGEKTAPSEGS